MNISFGKLNLKITVQNVKRKEHYSGTSFMPVMNMAVGVMSEKLETMKTVPLKATSSVVIRTAMETGVSMVKNTDTLIPD